MVANEVRHRARLVEDYADTPTIVANESRLGQVILNLLVNAVQAIPEGNVQRNEVRVVTRNEGDRVCIAISDTGAGIPPEHCARIFDPFFTTKPVGVGTGLGLSICEGIVTSLGGEITVQSEVGKGTTFRVSLPAGHVREEPPAVRAPQPARGPRGRVLVIDDDPLLLKVVAATLTRHHQVTALTDARAAIARIESGEIYDVILCDLMMPQVSGMDVYAQLLRVAPEMAARTVFMTGGAFTPRARAFLADVPNPTVEKPFEPRALVELVRVRMSATT
jgi:CheY-like chemotaxis protein/anti-sigma regulatory factor (Ser/Thr protein kinase)